MFLASHALIGHFAAQHLPENDGEAVHVHLLVVRQSQDHLRSHVGQSACEAGHLIGICRQLSPLHTSSQSEIKELQSAIRIKANILRLQI